jgi:Fe2+ or Zn2+ uptake regulation protein
VVVASDDAFLLAVLTSRIHVTWALRSGGWLGVGNDPVYAISRCFHPFPFPETSEQQKDRIRVVAEELDTLRKRVQDEHPELTLTQIYNVLEKLHAGEKLSQTEEEIKTKGLVLIIKELHDKIDALVAETYGWPIDLSDEQILEKLFALNAERAAEEKRGQIRWLRPDYQRARAGIPVETVEAEEEQLEAELIPLEVKAQKPSFPSGDVERTAVVFATLMAASGALDAKTIAKGFKQGAKVEPAIARVLASLARLGHVHTNDGRSFALLRSA